MNQICNTSNCNIKEQCNAGVFERQEKKYVLTEAQIEKFLQKVHTRFFADEHGVTKISSVYFDTPEKMMLSRSLEKPIYKEKLRIRAYGEVADDSQVFVELKKKFKGTVYKRRFQCLANDAYQFLGKSDSDVIGKHSKVGDVDGRIASSLAGLELINFKEVMACRQRYAQCGLFPAYKVVTDRVALFDDVDNIRMTIDVNPRFDDVNFDVAETGNEYALLPSGSCVLEIKSGLAYPRWLIDVLSDQNIYPQPFSKVGQAFKLSGFKPASVEEPNIKRHAVMTRALQRKETALANAL